MLPHEFLSELLRLVPPFKGYWDLEDNLSIDDDGSYTISSVCVEFSHYFIDQEKHKYISLHDINWTQTIIDDDLNEIFTWLESQLNLPALSGSISSCFLENISQTNAGEYAKSFMGPKSRFYFDQWHVHNKRL
ncbi:MAG: hypothetical protein ACI808_003089 [Paraglaciecola sp.]|jgi:hypothetical protein